jgi:hypothetical protein
MTIMIPTPICSIYHLDYNAPGTAELFLNRKTYRVGQSYFGINERTIYTITMILPKAREAKCQAKCHRYVRMDGCFVCPKGQEESYIMSGEGEVIKDLADLKRPCKRFDKYHMKYDEDDNQRSFAYFSSTGTIQHHPNCKPTVREFLVSLKETFLC